MQIIGEIAAILISCALGYVVFRCLVHVVWGPEDGEWSGSEVRDR